MATLNFIVRLQDKILTTRTETEVSSPASIWNVVSDLAQQYPQPGTRIVVKTCDGEEILHVGVATARQSGISA